MTNTNYTADEFRNTIEANTRDFEENTSRLPNLPSIDDALNAAAGLPQTTSQHRYLYESPRGFSNEFGVYRIPTESMDEAEALIDSYASNPNGRAYWVTRREAYAIVANQRAAARDNLRAGLNLYQNPVGATEITDWNNRY